MDDDCRDKEDNAPNPGFSHDPEFEGRETGGEENR
jgi:hypothetical protein